MFGGMFAGAEAGEFGHLELQFAVVL
jgi:hypothetical protein